LFLKHNLTFENEGNFMKMLIVNLFMLLAQGEIEVKNLVYMRKA